MKTKLFSNYLENWDSKETQYFSVRHNSIIGKIGAGFNNFNEITILLLFEAFNNIFSKNKSISANILVANDGSNKYLSFFEKQIIQKISSKQIKVLAFEKNNPVTEAFLSFSNTLTESFLLTIYLHKFNDEDKYCISFFNKNNDPLSSEIINSIIEEYKEIRMESFKENTTPNQYINFNKLLNEYTNYLLINKFTNTSNHMLKIAIIDSPLQNTFIKKILGKNDVEYKVLKNNIRDEKPEQIKYSILFKNTLKNIEYLFKFSYDYKKLFLYRRDYSFKYSFVYKLIDISNLLCNYLSFINNYVQTNEEFKQISNIYASHFVKKEYLINICSRYKINLDFSWKFENKKHTENNFLYFDESYNVYLKNNKKIKYDSFIFFNILIDMLNYYQTQGMKFEDINNQNVNESNKLIINEFELECHELNITDFETKLYIQDTIALLKISSIENIKDYYKNNNEKYIAKINFHKNEWMGIKYNFSNSKLVFLVQEKEKTKGNIAKKIKKFMQKFCLKYKTPLVNF
ncbi:hypothetical protein [Metamycoplasma gateae]|uniref:Alpha-D-phosphohexomutase alpha/beta/alpha domain-containing protein n=1 Tax=Metamycoplasma gateae TaxID=35769 RepID=A0ABZ2AIB9_9BACT|nr:hypothetical protein V2E26_01475 [Metamycoplasma gateae]